MRTYKLTIAYDGTNYQGWQRQSDTDRTIQGILEETLENCIGYQVQIDGSGRTGSCKDEGGGRIFDRHTFFCGVYG